MVISPDASKAVVHEWTRAQPRSDRVCMVEFATGKVTVLQDSKGQGVLQDRQLRLSADGASVWMIDDEIRYSQYSLLDGKMMGRCEISPQVLALANEAYEDLPVPSPDGAYVAQAFKSAVAVWDLKTGKPTVYPVDKAPADAAMMAYPLAGGTRVLMLAMSKDDKKPNVLSLVDLKTGKSTELTRITENYEVRTSLDGKRAYVFREEGKKTAWTVMEQWDLDAGKAAKTVKVEPPMATIGLLPGPGDTVLFHEYAARAAVIWDFRRGKLAAIVSPEGQSLERFDITRDGKKLVAFVGKLDEKGVVQPGKIAVYDVSAVVKP
jgi:hypothetical protein